jgi:hypothetical protein
MYKNPRDDIQRKKNATGADAQARAVEGPEVAAAQNLAGGALEVLDADGLECGAEVFVHLVVGV